AGGPAGLAPPARRIPAASPDGWWGRRPGGGATADRRRRRVERGGLDSRAGRGCGGYGSRSPAPRATRTARHLAGTGVARPQRPPTPKLPPDIATDAVQVGGGETCPNVTRILPASSGRGGNVPQRNKNFTGRKLLLYLYDQALYDQAS